MVTRFGSAFTSTRPAISSKRSVPALARPRPASTQPVPTLGWPANGISVLRLKMRTRALFALSAGGRTNVVSLRLNSAARDCISPSLRPIASGKTASGLPPKRWSVNTSTVTNEKLRIGLYDLDADLGGYAAQGGDRPGGCIAAVLRAVGLDAGGDFGHPHIFQEP